MLVVTKIFKLDKYFKEDDPAILEAGNMLKEGLVVAFPTETVYGLGANALDTGAITRIYKAKGRPSDNPLIVHIASLEQLYPLVEEVNEISLKLIDAFWPGPLTIVFKKKEGISELVTAGLSTIAIRMPNHPVALAIIKAANLPIAAPSANKSGKPSPTNANHVIHDLNGLINGIVDGGSTGIGVESTVIDVCEEVPTILRPGGITVEELENIIGEVQLDNALIDSGNKPRSPGMKYKHYAPQGEMWIIQGNNNKVVEEINQIINEKKSQNKRVGVLTTEEHKSSFKNFDIILAFGTRENLYPLAVNLYDSLRIFDLEKIDCILVEGVTEKGIGLTIMNRLKKAANQNLLMIND